MLVSVAQNTPRYQFTQELQSFAVQLSTILKEIYRTCCFNEIRNRNRIQLSSDHRRITEFLRTKNTDKRCLRKIPRFQL